MAQWAAPQHMGSLAGARSTEGVSGLVERLTLDEIIDGDSLTVLP
jgi:hypothetical protein